MEVLSHIQAQHDDFDNEELDALDKGLVPPVYVDDSKDACRHAYNFYKQQVHEAGDVQWSKKLVRIVERGVKPCCSKKLRVQQSVNFKAKDKAKSSDSAYCTFVVCRPVPKCRVIHHLFLKNHLEKEINRYCEHDRDKYQIYDRSDSKSLSEVENNKHA